MPLLSLKNLSKRYDSTPAVSDVSLEVERGEFFGLLGPSGCGKTTTLRMIAGLEKPDAGRIELDGRDITNLSAERRAFGLRARHKALAEVREQVAAALELVQLSAYEKRKVDELSGGQQQRVAIAR